jgi:hypothetical protein
MVEMPILASLSRSLLHRPSTHTSIRSSAIAALQGNSWVCRRCIASSIPGRFSGRFPAPVNGRFGPSTVRTVIAQTGQRTKARRQGLVFAMLATGLVGASVVGWVDGKHYIIAAERALRVAKALSLCIQEFVIHLIHFSENELFIFLLLSLVLE